MVTLRSRTTPTLLTRTDMLCLIDAALDYSTIHRHLTTLFKQCKEDPVRLAQFWFAEGSFPFHLEDEAHREALRWILGRTGLQHPLLVALLDSLAEKGHNLLELGVVRVDRDRGTRGGHHYRIRVGECT